MEKLLKLTIYLIDKWMQDFKNTKELEGKLYYAEVKNLLENFDIDFLKKIAEGTNFKEIVGICTELYYLKTINQDLENRVNIGLNLPLCIGDIMKDKVRENSVICIISSGMFYSAEQIMDIYYQKFWSKFDSKELYELLKRLYPVIYQPKKHFNSFKEPNTFYGNWMNISSGKYL